MPEHPTPSGAQEQKCHTCGAPATCYGSYEGHPWDYGCDECCGHGNEDGTCHPLASGAQADERARLVERAGRLVDHLLTSADPQLGGTMVSYRQLKEIREALRLSAPAETGEPVAWMVEAIRYDGTMERSWTGRRADADMWAGSWERQRGAGTARVVPLYRRAERAEPAREDHK